MMDETCTLIGWNYFPLHMAVNTLVKLSMNQLAKQSDFIQFYEVRYKQDRRSIAKHHIS